MRKLLCAKTLVAVALTTSVLACGSSPTSPTATANAQPDVTSPAPTPTPVPTPPDPVPVPAPTPTPVPEPPAPPIPAPVRTFDGVTSQAHWFAAPVLPEHFELQITSSSVEAGGHSFPILSRGPDVNVIAGTRNVETLTLEYHGPADGSGSWSWTYNGQPGQANGTLTRR